MKIFNNDLFNIIYSVTKMKIEGPNTLHTNYNNLHKSHTSMDKTSNFKLQLVNY